VPAPVSTLPAFASSAEFALLSSEAVVLVPTEWAAADWRARYNDAQRAAGLSVWRPAQVLSWSQWLRSLWNELVVDGAEDRLLMNAAQEALLWRTAIAATSQVPGLGSPQSLATLAHTAFRIAAHWSALERVLTLAASSAAARGHLTRDVTTFLGWAAAFEQLCVKDKLLSASVLEAALTRHAQAHRLHSTRSVVLLGFAERHPSQQVLLDALTATGTDLREQELTLCNHTTVQTLRAADFASEARLIAAWVRNAFRQNGGAPPLRIAVVAAEEALIAPLESCFREALAPELTDIATDATSAPWSSAVLPLRRTSLVETALTLLRLLAGSIPLEQASALLLSPYLVPQSPAAVFAEFDAFVLRQQQMLRPEVTVQALRKIAEHSGSRSSEAVRPWLARLASAQTKLNANSAEKPYGEWAALFRQSLHTLGWPGERSLTPQESLVAEAWDKLLDLLATLDFRGTKLPMQAALDELERLSLETGAPSLSQRAAVQILTPAEASGARFDAVILAGFNANKWPVAERAQPLLPWSLQAALGMPGTDAAASAARAVRQTALLLNSASSVLVTYAHQTAEGEQRLAPLIAAHHVTQLNADDVELAPALPLVAEETLVDDRPLPPLTSAEVFGGAGILRAQAACGFQAFAATRLYSVEPETRTTGLNGMDTGTLVHAALQNFWGAVPSQQALIDMTDDRRKAQVQQAVERALTAFAGEGAWDAAYLEVQRRRTVRLVERWLQQETTRAPFAIQALEAERELQLGPLTMKLRVDRIDRVEDGVVLIDYKTGTARTADWESARPAAPQLPLYSLLEGDAVRGVAFARLRASAKETRWTGVQAVDGLLGNKRAAKTVDLELQTGLWRDVLTQLAEDFAAGRAEVSPKDPAETCSYCAQRLLCRIDPAAFTAMEEEASAGDEDE
jgi:ATP-dependent helicase/nuclease subunit B